MPRPLCGEDEWPKLNMCGGGRISIQQNTLVSVRQCPVRYAAGMARRIVLFDADFRVVLLVRAERETDDENSGTKENREECAERDRKSGKRHQNDEDAEKDESASAGH